MTNLCSERVENPEEQSQGYDFLNKRFCIDSHSPDKENDNGLTFKIRILGEGFSSVNEKNVETNDIEDVCSIINSSSDQSHNDQTTSYNGEEILSFEKKTNSLSNDSQSEDDLEDTIPKKLLDFRPCRTRLQPEIIR